MDTTITSAAVATLISASVAAVVSLAINKSNARKALEDRLDGILKIAIQYPYLESPSFTKTWKDNRKSEDEKYLRYDNYCILIFNYLEARCRFHGNNFDKVQAQFDLKNWVRLHRDYWEFPSDDFENTDGYSKKFRDIVNSCLK